MIVAKVTLGLLLGWSSHHKAPWAITVHYRHHVRFHLID